MSEQFGKTKSVGVVTIGQVDFIVVNVLKERNEEYYAGVCFPGGVFPFGNPKP